MLVDHGRLDADLHPLVGAVLSLGIDNWERRVDPESEQTWKIRETSPAFPRRLIDAILDRVTCFGPGTTSRVVLSMVPAGAEILPHTDDFGDYLKRTSIHCHLPLVTHPDVVMGGPDGEQHMPYGHVFQMDATCRHWVRNLSDVDRVHLLFAFHPDSLRSA